MSAFLDAPPAPGHRLPAEWEAQDAVWLAWPGPLDWPGRHQAVRLAYAEMIRVLTRGQDVQLLAADARAEADARNLVSAVGGDLRRVRLRRVATDRSWMRDNGPLFLRTPPGGLAVAGFRFNAWARYANHRRDCLVPGRAAAVLGLPVLPMKRKGRRIVLEGGAIDVNGSGTLVTTEECLLDPVNQVRNPGFRRQDYEALFAEALGAANVIWLGRGIAGDDTHGHVDDICRFVNRRTLVACVEKNPADVNHAPLARNMERLQDARLEDGSRPEVVPLPMPGPVSHKGMRLPASYANFLIARHAVLVPTFNDPCDRLALGILAELFDRPVVGIHATDLVMGQGAIHCLTMQQPAASGLPRA